MTNYFEAKDDHLCEAANCFEMPTTEIKLKVGQRQTITLHVLPLYFQSKKLKI
jgi:hypothetical protein